MKNWFGKLVYFFLVDQFFFGRPIFPRLDRFGTGCFCKFWPGSSEVTFGQFLKNWPRKKIGQKLAEEKIGQKLVEAWKSMSFGKKWADP